MVTEHSDNSSNHLARLLCHFESDQTRNITRETKDRLSLYVIIYTNITMSINHTLLTWASFITWALTSRMVDSLVLSFGRTSLFFYEFRVQCSSVCVGNLYQAQAGLDFKCFPPRDYIDILLHPFLPKNKILSKQKFFAVHENSAALGYTGFKLYYN